MVSTENRLKAASPFIILFAALSLQPPFVSAACTNGADGCQTCFGSSCQACKEGFFKVNGSCTACGVANCWKCSSASACLSCVDGYYWYSYTKCLKCFESCQTCYAGTLESCTSCRDGYSFSPTLGCVACPSECQTCYSKIGYGMTSVYCATCFEGTPLGDGTCPARYASLTQKY